jgi:hypothetical protein
MVEGFMTNDLEDAMRLGKKPLRHTRRSSVQAKGSGGHRVTKHVAAERELPSFAATSNCHGTRHRNRRHLKTEIIGSSDL